MTEHRVSTKKRLSSGEISKIFTGSGRRQDYKDDNKSRERRRRTRVIVRVRRQKAKDKYHP